MTAVTSPSAVSPAITEADRILRTDGNEKYWPRNREARFALEWASKSLAGALDAYWRLAETGFTPLPEDEMAALAYAEDQVGECAKALQRTFAEYQKRRGAAGLAGEAMAS